MQNKVEFYGVVYQIEPTKQENVELIENISDLEEEYKANREQFESGTKESLEEEKKRQEQLEDYEEVEDKKPTKKRTYAKEIAMLKEALNEKGNMTDDIDEILTNADNLLLSLDDEYRELEDKEYAGYEAQRRILSKMAIKQKEYVEETDQTLFNKNEFTLKITDSKPYCLNYSPNYKEVLKNNESRDRYGKVVPDTDNQYVNDLAVIMRNLSSLDMIDETNMNYEEGVKRYAGKNIFIAREKLEKYFKPAEEITDEAKLKEFYAQKAEEFDYDKFEYDLKFYKENVSDYKAIFDQCKEKFSKFRHCTNIDVLREKNADAVITEDTHTSNVVSSVFTILKFYKQFEKDQEHNSMEKFLRDPSKLISQMTDIWAKQYSNDQYKNKSRGAMLAKLDERSAYICEESMGFQSAIQRLEECMTTIYPYNSGDYQLTTSVNMNLPIQKLFLNMNRTFDLANQEKYNKVFTQLAVISDKDFSPEKIAAESYFDYQTNSYIEVPDNDLYIRDNNIDLGKAFNNCIDMIFDYDGANELDTTHSLMDTVLSAQNFASEMYLKHYDEMSPKVRNEYRMLAADPAAALAKKGIQLPTNDHPVLDEKAQSFVEKANAMDEINKEMGIYEKFVVEKENKFNKDLAKLQKDIAKAEKKGDVDKLAELKTQEETMKAKRIETLVRDYNKGRLPEGYAVNRIQSILSGDVKEVKGIFKTSGYKDAKSYCKANELEDLSKEEMEAVYQSALDEKKAYVQERAGILEPTEKIDIMAELTRHENIEVTKKVVEGLKEVLEEPAQNANLSKSLDLYKNKEKAKDNNLGI